MDRQADDAKITAQCPGCGLQLVLSAAMLEKRLKCPQCNTVAHFAPCTSDAEVLKDAAHSVGQGIFEAGSLVGRAGLWGLSRIKKGHERARLRKQLIQDIQNHLASEVPSLGTIEAFVKRGREAECSLDEAVRPFANLLWPCMSRLVQAILKSGVPDPEQIETLRAYSDTLKPPGDVARYVADLVATLKQVRQIEAGDVGPLSPEKIAGLIVRSSEIVWHQCSAEVEEANRNETETHEGALHITNLRIVFTSRTRPDEMSIDAINAVDVETDRVILVGKSQRGSLEFLVDNPLLAAAYIRHAIRIYHRQVDVGFEQGDSRRISQDVKQTVWQRDGGRCVECGAKDYLEFDHIIPFSLGGASTAENLQLLCRRCNLKKSSRL